MSRPVSQNPVFIAFPAGKHSLPDSSPLTGPFPLHKRTGSKGPSLHRRYPASSVHLALSDPQMVRRPYDGVRWSRLSDHPGPPPLTLDYLSGMLCSSVLTTPVDRFGTRWLSLWLAPAPGSSRFALPFPVSGRVGIHIGSNPGSAHATREIEIVMPRLGAGDALERDLGQGMDCPAKRHGTLFLLRRPRARVSRRPDRVAAPLRGPRAVVSAGHYRLLDQCHGWPAIPVREQGSGPRADRHTETRCDSVAGGKHGPDAGAGTAAGGRCASPLVYHGVPPGGVQSGVVRADAGEADCHSELSQISAGRLGE